jgi:hypothetical protein
MSVHDISATTQECVQPIAASNTAVLHQTYTGGTVAVERAAVDLRIRVCSQNSSALGVPCCAPRTWRKIRKVQERTGHDQHSSTYTATSTVSTFCSSVALESTGVDLHLGTISKNCTPLWSWMSAPRPDIERKFELVLFPETGR